MCVLEEKYRMLHFEIYLQPCVNGVVWSNAGFEKAHVILYFSTSSMRI